MTVEEMLKLIDAGFTAEELRAMKNAPAPDPEPAPAPAEPAPEAKPSADEKMENLLNEIRDLKKAVFGMNILNSSQPAPKSADDVLENLMKGNR